MNETPKCPKCGGEMDVGEFPGDDNFVLSNQTHKSVFARKSVFIRRAHACLVCGFVELYLDPQELRAKLDRS